MREPRWGPTLDFLAFDSLASTTLRSSKRLKLLTCSEAESELPASGMLTDDTRSSVTKGSLMMAASLSLFFFVVCVCVCVVS